MSGLHIVTLGCRLNAFESEVMRAAAEGQGEIVIVNTCAVTAEAERQARQAIRRARRDHPAARIVVTGCAAQLAPERFAAMPEVDRVVGNRDKLDAAALAGSEPIRVSDVAIPDTAPPAMIEGFEGRARAFVQVQQGCDHHCTYCIVPQARGPARSIPPERVVEQVRRLVANGCPEVALTGLDASSYGRDLAGRPSLGRLAAWVLEAEPDLKRLRLTSLDPAVADDDLMRLLAGEPRLMPHLHLSVQALDDTVLKRMKRRHRRADVQAFMARARDARPDIVFGADLIAGFPTEDEGMFETTLAAVEDLDFLQLHVFPFSPRPGTPAARMPGVAAEERKRRAARLRSLGDRLKQRRFATWVGRSVEVLAEEPARGLTRHYVPVRLGFVAAAGEIVVTAIDGFDSDGLTASRRS